MRVHTHAGSLIAVTLGVTILLLGSAAPAGSPAYRLYIAPGLSPGLSPEQVVGHLPRPLDGGRLTGQIETIDLVAYVRATDLPKLDARVTPPDVSEFWFVRFRGQLSLSLPGEHRQGYGEGYYLVHHNSGVQFQSGVLSELPLR